MAGSESVELDDTLPIINTIFNKRIDEIAALKKLRLTDESQEELNILLVGAGDLRHVLLTIARAYRHHKRKLHFYIQESCLEVYARDMLFLAIVLEQQKRMGLQEKTEMFLELFGNILVRKQAEEYVQKMATEFIKMVTDFDYLEKKLPVFDLGLLKFKERDFLEGIFKFWRNPDQTVFNVSQYWDLRQRKYLGTRYDTRMNVYDWDYQMRLVQRDADIINLRAYKEWRNTGVAFEVREADYDVPNKTMASGLVINVDGQQHLRRGYWGDILVSPYVTLGIQCEDESFFKKANKAFINSASDIAEFNVLSMCHEIATRTRYVKPEVTDTKPESNVEQTPKLTEITEESAATGGDKRADLGKEYDQEVEEELQKSADDTEKKRLDEEFSALPLEDVKISFLPLGSVLDMPKKSKFQKHFHMAYFSNSMVHLLKPDVNPIFADRATVIIESARYMLELKLEKVKEFAGKVEGMAREAGCKSVGKCDPEKANFLKLGFERSDAS